MEITLRLETAGEFTQQELEIYIAYQLGLAICPSDNPFISEEGNASIEGVDFC